MLVETPGPHDVVLGRGRWYAMHSGNRRLQTVINSHLERYQATPLRKAKTSITHEILDQIKNCPDNPGRFLRYDAGQDGWLPVEDDVARLKISQAMRYSMRSPTDPQEETQPPPPRQPQKPAAAVTMARRRKRSERSSSNSSESTSSNNGSGNSTGKGSHLKRLLSASTTKTEPDSTESSEQSMPPPRERRPSPLTAMPELLPPITKEAKKHFEFDFEEQQQDSEEKDEEEVLVTDQEIYEALGYGPNPFANLSLINNNVGSAHCAPDWRPAM